jgi:hypothetical protein
MGLGGLEKCYLIMKIKLHRSFKKDKWGQPVLAIDCEYKENEAKCEKI